MKGLIAILVLVSLLLLTTVSVFAVPPYRDTGTYEEVWQFTDCADHGDWDFVIMSDQEGRWIDNYYFNQDGDLIRLFGHLEGEAVLYNPNNPAKVANGKYNQNWNVYFDPESGDVIEQQGSGIIWSFHVQGEGKLYHIVGRVLVGEDGTLDHTVGQWDWVANDVALCEYFAEL